MPKTATSTKTHSQEVTRTDKRPDPIHGFLFQLKLLMLFLYRGVTGGYSFNLGTEIEEAKKFDDLVFEFTQNKKKFYRLLQAKHKFDRTRNSISADSLFNEINGDFYLPKYFFSYLDAKKESLFRGGIIKDVIICTNINFNDHILNSRDFKLQRIKNKDDILEIKIGSLTKPLRYKFKVEIIPILKKHLNDYKSQSKRFLSDYNDNDIKDFLNHLIFAVDCPSEQELGEIIKGEIGKEFDFLNVDNIYSRFMITMLDWLQGKERGRFISDEEGRKFFEEAKKGIPVLFNIRSPVESFTGRAKELDLLHELLKEHTAKTRTVCISGIGGIGKSELARKYISEFRTEYNNNVLWFNAESYQTMEVCFRSLASDKLGIATKNANGEEKGLMSIIGDVYRALGNRICIMIFDNAQHYRSKNEFDEGIDRFLPSSSDVSKLYILITSRNQRWPATIHILSLNMFEKDEAIQFVSKALKTNSDESSALADELHYFPLALQQAVSYISVQNMKLQNIGTNFGITSYLKCLKEKSKDVLNFSFPEDSAIDYTKTVFITWNVTLDLIRKSQNGNEALKIMNILSYMAPEDIPIEVFLNLVNGQEMLSSALDILNNYSMITIHRKIISLEQHVVMVNVHGLVQEVIRLKLVEENKEKSVLEKALTIFKERANVNNQTLSHAISVWDHSSKNSTLSVGKKNVCSLVSTFISIELLNNYRHTELYSFIQKAITFSNSLPMVDKEVQGYLVILKHNKGFLLEALGKYSDAIKTFQEALSSSESINGKTDQYTLMIKYDLAETFFKQGDYKEAVKLSIELVGTRKKIQDENDLQSSLEKLTLAEALLKLGKYDEPLDILKDIKKIIEQSDSIEEKDCLAYIHLLEGEYENSLRLYETLDYSKMDTPKKNVYNMNKKSSIAQLYYSQKKYSEALKEYKEVAEMVRSMYGENYPVTLRCQYVIAELLIKQANSDEALKLFEETYKKQKNVLGEDHPETLDTLFGIAITLEDQGKFRDSLRTYEEVLDKRITKLGKNHPSSLEASTSIGDVLYKLNDYNKALEKYNEVLKMKKKAKSRDNNLAIMIKIGEIYLNKNEINKALPFFQDAIKVIKDTEGCEHQLYNYLSVSTHISQAYQKQQKYDLALENFQNQLKFITKKLGDDHPDCLSTEYNIAKTLSFKGEYDESLKMCRQLLKKINIILGDDHPLSLLVRNDISLMLLVRDKVNEALQECLKVKEIHKRSPAKDQNIIASTNKILVQIFSKQEKHEEVLKLLTETLEIEESIPNQNPLTVADTKSDIAKSLIRLGKDESAIKFVRESQRTFMAVLGAEHPKTRLQSDVLKYLSSVEKLFTAIKQNKNVQFLKELVTSGCDFATQDDEGRTLLHHAVNQGNIETVRYLLAIGVDFTLLTKKGNSCLHVAVLKGHRKIVEVLLQHSSRYRSKEFIDFQTVLGGMTALHVAAKSGNLDIVKALLKNGAKYNIKNKDNKRPIELSNDEEVKSLLRLVDVHFDLIGGRGIKVNEMKALKNEDLITLVNARNENGMTLLQVAINNEDQTSSRILSSIIEDCK